MTKHIRGSLHIKTLELVRKAPRHIKYKEMANQCGVSVAWISRFAADKINHPCVNAVERLHDFLVGVDK